MATITFTNAGGIETSGPIKENGERVLTHTLLAGTVMWFAGLLANVPTGWLVCNGQAVSRTTYSALYNVIGTKYGTGNGSTTFNVPNLSDGNGRFIRAGFADSTIGTKQDDAIRNITGAVTSYSNKDQTQSDSGAMYGTWKTFNYSVSGGSNKLYGRDFFFDANNGTTSTNPMAGHANGDDIHPYDIYFLPIIAY